MDFEALVKHISTIQNTLQAQAAHAVNLALTSRNWLMGCYIVEFEQNGEDRAAYGEQLLKKLEQRLKTKGLNERRFREFRRLYLIYPQLKEQILHCIISGNEIRNTLSAEFTEPIRHTICARLNTADNQINNWNIPAEKLFNRLPYSHLKFISKIENPVKRAFYEMEAMRDCRSARELERQIMSLIEIQENPNRSNIEPKLDYSINLINNIDSYIRDAPVGIKIKLISSMFPEKIEFDGKTYRTNSYNKVLDLIYQQTNELRGVEKKNGESFSTFSASVPRPAFEITKSGTIRLNSKTMKFKLN